ncbi:MAG: FAD-dependent oxidoreductase [Acidobacteriia bacterium]|nr:FAD-dependent oxidoreductase [Terriglobia bacterium]
MALVKLEIDGKRIIADGNRTVLDVARENGIRTIPTLCHDDRLEPFASCFLCVVKVKGARSLLPACSTKVGPGMVVETDDPEIRRSRKAALELLLSNHYADCVGPCQLACPAEVDIQGYIALAALGKHRDAVQLIKEKNPLPSVCGRVCTRPCEVKGCRRNLLDEAVGIDWIKRYVTDLDLGRDDAWRPEVAPLNGKSVAVVGAGPAGLSCAYYLAVRGYQVNLFEALPEAGGMLRYGIPEYRLPKDVLDLEINQILSLGVRLKTNTLLGRDFTVQSLKRDGHQAVYLGLGAWKSSDMRVKGEDSEGVLSGIEFLKNFGLRRKIDLRGRVLVIGGGNTAIDCARTVLRLGVKEVRLLYRRTRNEMPANAAEIHEAEQEGVNMDFLVAPVRVITAGGRVSGLECLRMELGEPDASGRRSPKPVRGSEFVVDADFILSAIGQATRVPELLDGRVPDFLPFGEVLNLTRWQTIQTNEGTGETSVDGVFAGGDVVTGAATAIEAIAAGRRAAHAIDAYLTGGKARPEPKEFVSRKDTFAKVSVADLRSPAPSRRRPMPLLSVEDRVRGFMEVEQGYTPEDVEKEARRCLECGCTALFECDLRRYATEYGVDISRFLGEATQHKVDTSHPLIELDPNKCILCGRCVRICSEVVGVSAYGYLQRGFSTVVRPAMGGSLLETDCVTCGLCIGTCPTGAIAQKIPLVKPGPWRTRQVPSICSFCGVGCRIAYDTFGDTVVKVSSSEDAPVTFGNHCKKGRFGYDVVHAEDRLAKAKVRAGRVQQDAPIDDAIGYAAMRLRELSRRYTGSEMAVFVSPRFTNEEAYLAQKLARVALRTHDVGSLAHLVNRELQCPEVVSTATYRDVADAQVILLAGSRLDEEHFVADLIVKRAIRGGGKLVYIHPEANPVARFAEVFIRCRPGTEALVLLGIVQEVLAASGAAATDRPWLEEALAGLGGDRLLERTGADPALVKEAARLVGRSLLKVLIFNKDYRGPRTARDGRVYAAAASILGASLLSLREKANMQGLLDMGCFPDWFPGYRSVRDESVVDDLEKEWCVALRDLETAPADLAARLRERKIKVAVVLGEDPLGDPDFPEDLKAGLLATDFLVVGDLVLTETARAAHVVLPLGTVAETSGTYTNSERRIQRIARAVPPATGLETWQVIAQLAGRMGYRFKMKYADVGDVMEEIRRVAPIYRNAAIGEPEAGSVWDLSGFPLARVEPDARDLSVEVAPARTVHLDRMESRFDAWFDGLMNEARRAGAAVAAD